MTARLLVVGLVLAVLAAVALLAVTLNEKSIDGPPVTVTEKTAPMIPPPISREDPTTSVPTTRTSVPSTIVATARSAPIANVPFVVWDRLAECESAGKLTPSSPWKPVNWDDTRGGYEGGLHFTHDTWVRAGGRRFAEHAYQATRLQQIQIAASWLRRTSWRQWPSCSRQLGLR